MARTFTREDLSTPEGRAQAMRALTWGDHGILRLIYDNTHEVSPGKVWRSFQPGPKRLAKWRDLGVKTVVNLRGDKPSPVLFLEEEACDALDLKLINLRAYSREAPSIEFLTKARTLFRSVEYPILMHCKSGADRAGLMATLYLFFEEGVPLDSAMRQLSWSYGHIKQGKTGVIDHALNGYVSYAQKRNIDLSDVDAFFEWAQTRYDPAAMKKDFIASWWGTLLTEKILRRE